MCHMLTSTDYLLLLTVQLTGANVQASNDQQTALRTHMFTSQFICPHEVTNFLVNQRNISMKNG